MQRVAEMSTPLRNGFGKGTSSLVPLDANLDAALAAEGSEAVTKLSEIPCRVSSDLHEWRNESATVLPTDTANL